MPRKRPTTLSVLCTLSLLAGTWGLMTHLSTYENAEEVSVQMIKTMEETKGKLMGTIRTGAERDMVGKLFADFGAMTDTVRIKQNALFGVMSSILTLLGASLMYRMRKKGFGIYLLGIGVYIASPLVVYSLKNLAGLSLFIWSLIIGLVFSLFYWRMIKYMD